MNSILTKDVQYIKGIGPKKAEKLKKLNIETVEDLIFNFPRQFEDRDRIKPINLLEDGDKVTVKGQIVGMNRRKIRQNMSILTVNIIEDGYKARLVFYNRDYIISTFKKNDHIMAFGKVKKPKKTSTPELMNCEIEYLSANPKNIGRIIPVYSLTYGISNKDVMGAVRNAWDMIDFEIDEYIPEWVMKNYHLCGINYALKNIHFPKDRNALKVSVYRLIFEEFLTLQLGLFMFKSGREGEKGIKIPVSDELEAFKKNLGFNLTKGQTKALNDCLDDMKSDKSMNRLIQGDVGSGKTAVAMLLALNCALEGMQCAMMAPTEILATQHLESFEEFLKGTGKTVGILKSAMSAKEKREVLEKIKDGTLDIVVGTHALIQDNVEFKNLGLVITDEQHRFGVSQRGMLAGKGDAPNVLVMSATPIPRTLALILYGDLDITIIDELPPGRKPVKTLAVDESKSTYIYDNLIPEEIDKGRQVYVVCPLVEDSENIEALSSENMYGELLNKYRGKYRVGLIHGKMKQDEKDDVMIKFKNGEFDILVSTTVIEVGVNVVNASLMIIENAERFGLAQLHQLRGRVGRGSHESKCILIYHKDSDVCRKRMAIMEKTNDGFVISQKDLEIRGTGEFFGTRQHGLPELKLANLFKHVKILQKSQEAARIIISHDPHLENRENRELKNKILHQFGTAIEDTLILN